MEVRRGRVLVIDDCRDTVEALATLLNIFGYESRAARTGLDAIAIAALFRPDIVLLDIGLPDISGYEVARRLQQPSRYLIALTGYAREIDREHAFAAGCDHHMSKPITAAALRATLASCQRIASRPRAAATCLTR